jgi:serine/threonine protein kinase
MSEPAGTEHRAQARAALDASGQPVKVPSPSPLTDGGSAETRPSVSAFPAEGGARADWPEVPGYEILGELGEGGMGVVYKARQLGLNRVVALKVIRKERLVRRNALRRFRREAEAAARLLDPHVVTIYQFGPAGDTYFLAMEYVDGIDLQRLIEREGPLPVARACDYIRQAAQGLQHAFEQQLVHRDIKPANLIVTLPPAEPGAVAPVRASPGRGSVLKLLDLGLARLLHEAIQPGPNESSAVTQDGAFIGTPDFIAPEQAQNPSGADIRADLYSLGCSFYYLLTGRTPFPGGTLLDKLDGHRWGEPAPVDRVRSDVPAEVIAVLRKTMAKRPEERYQTPAELAEDLEPFTRTGSSANLPRVLLRGSDPAAAAELTLPAQSSSQECRRLEGHTDWVKTVMFTPDGRYLLSGSWDQTVRLWETASGKEVRSFATHESGMHCIAFSPDGFLAISGNWDNTLRLWDVRTGNELLCFTGHTGIVDSVAVSPDGRRAASAGWDQSVRLWDMQTGEELHRFLGHTNEVTSVAFAPDGRRLVSGGHDGTIQLWDAAGLRPLLYFDGQVGVIWDVHFSADGRRVVYCGDTIRLWDIEGSLLMRLKYKCPEPVTSVVCTPDGRQVLAGGSDGVLRLFDVATRHEVHRFVGHTSKITSVVCSQDGRHAASGSGDKLIRVWDLPG